MTNKYSFSPWTIEWETLKKLSSEEQNAILQNTRVWDDAHFENEEITRILSIYNDQSQNNTEKQVENKNYEWMDEIVLNSLWWRKIYVKFLEADDSTLTYTLSNWALSNFPESEINNNSLLVTKNKRGNYHFWFDADKKRKEELWMRSLTKEEMESPELEAYLVEKLWKDRKSFPGYRSYNGRDFSVEEDIISFWWEVSDKYIASRIEFSRLHHNATLSNFTKSNGVSSLGVKD